LKTKKKEKKWGGTTLIYKRKGNARLLALGNLKNKKRDKRGEKKNQPKKNH
jgi:hypothetical protein